MKQAIPIPTLHLFPKLNDLLVSLLRSLSPDDWNKPTLAKQWTVKDVAAHLLDTNMRSIASANGHEIAPDREIKSYRDLVDYLNDLNNTWVRAMRRVSPLQLTDLLKNTNRGYVDYYHSLDLFTPAKYSVAWAGEDLSLNWFHIARDYTEKWHHQQQIREAVGQTAPLMTRELFYPCIDTFMRGLPHTYRDTKADEGTVIYVNITGDAGGDWYLTKNADNWQLGKTQISQPAASISIDPDIAWRLFTKGVEQDFAIKKSTIKGNENFAAPLFDMVSVIALR